jgi:hypothetical protein
LFAHQRVHLREIAEALVAFTRTQSQIATSGEGSLRRSSRRCRASSRFADDLQPFLVLRSDDLHRRILADQVTGIDQSAVDLSGKRLPGETGANLDGELLPKRVDRNGAARRQAG